MTDGLIMKYFVLKPKGTDAYAAASRAAMRSYGNHIAMENPELRDALWAWAQRETDAILAMEQPK